MNRRQMLMLAGSITASSLPVQVPYAQDGRRWRSETEMPLGIQEIYPAVFNSHIHVAGGFTLSRSGVLAVTNRHFSFNPQTGIWQEAAPLPAQLHHPNLVSAGNRIYALGGFLYESRRRSWVMQNQTFIYSPDTNSWSTGEPVPVPNGETVCAVLGDRIHLVGGRRPIASANSAWSDHTDSDTHWIYEPATDQWHDAAPALSARNSAAGAVIDDLLYVVGGRTVRSGNVANTEVYDPSEDRWRIAAPMPLAQGGLAAAALDGMLYAFGGEGGSAPRPGVFPDAWMYAPSADRWEAIAPMPTPRHGLGAVTINDRIYVVGGATIAGAAGTSAVVESYG